MNDSMIRLQAWYDSQCNGQWEHTFGIKIETLDNPGWKVTVDLHDTDLSDVMLGQIDMDRSEDDWIRCTVAKEIFEGYGGACNLVEVIEVFLGLVRKARPLSATE